MFSDGTQAQACRYQLPEVTQMFGFLAATRYFFSIAARVAGMGGDTRTSSVHVHWDRISRQWVRRELS